jgi:hypothetical protein
MGPTLEQFDEIIDKLVKDTANAVHDMYRGALGGHTTKARTEVGRQTAHAAVAALLGVSPTPMRPSSGTTSGTGPALKTSSPNVSPTPVSPHPASGRPSMATSAVPSGPVTNEELDAIRKCVLAWLPMGAPNQTAADSRCIAAGRELIPSWGERELARGALAKVR